MINYCALVSFNPCPDEKRNVQPSFSPRLMFRLAPSFEGFVASLKNLQYNFPKIHLFWKGKASLNPVTLDPPRLCSHHHRLHKFIISLVNFLFLHIQSDLYLNCCTKYVSFLKLRIFFRPLIVLHEYRDIMKIPEIWWPFSQSIKCPRLMNCHFHMSAMF